MKGEQAPGNGHGHEHEQGQEQGPGRDDQERPSIGELRRRVLEAGTRIGSGWPVIDAVSGGLPAERTTVIRGPGELRMQVLARLAAWSAGEGYPTIIASHARTTEELWLAVGAGGLGLPPDALLTAHAHDAWIDDRLRVLDIRVFGGPDAPEQTAAAMSARPASVLVIDDYPAWTQAWDSALDPRFGMFDLRQWPRTARCTLVLGVTWRPDFSDWVERDVFTVRLTPDDHSTRVTVSAHDETTRERRTVLLRDGFLEPPSPGARLLRRKGVTNTWQDRSERDIASFASALGGEVVSMEWEREDDFEPPTT